ncbi:hypothetical protein JCM11491_000910 [Sporobolomyces phaffii]
MTNTRATSTGLTSSGLVALGFVLSEHYLASDSAAKLTLLDRASRSYFLAFVARLRAIPLPPAVNDFAKLDRKTFDSLFPTASVKSSEETSGNRHVPSLTESRRAALARLNVKIRDDEKDDDDAEGVKAFLHDKQKPSTAPRRTAKERAAAAKRQRDEDEERARQNPELAAMVADINARKKAKMEADAWAIVTTGADTSGKKRRRTGMNKEEEEKNAALLAKIAKECLDYSV